MSEEEEAIIFAQIQPEDQNRVVLCVDGRKAGGFAAVNKHNKSTLWTLRISALWRAYEQLPQTGTKKAAGGHFETKRDVVNKVNEAIVFLKSVDNANGNLENMTWKYETNEKLIIEKTEQKLRDEKKKWRIQNGTDTAPLLTPQELNVILSSTQNNAALGYASDSLSIRYSKIKIWCLLHHHPC